MFFDRAVGYYCDMETQLAGYLTVAQFARRHGVSGALVRKWIADGRIPGAVQLAALWLIPESAPRPERRPPGPAPKPASPAKSAEKRPRGRPRKKL